MKAPVCALVSCLLVAVAFPEAHAGASPAPSRWRRHSRSQRETGDAGAARQLLLSLLGLPNAANATLLAALMPTTDDPCLPAGLSTLEADAAITASATEGSSSGSGGIRAASSSSSSRSSGGGADDDFKGTCGPQPPSATRDGTTGGGSATPDMLYGSSPVGQPAFPPSAPSLTAAPTSPPAPTSPCAWKWLSCSNWRIVAVNLSCSPTSLGCAGGPAGVPLSGSLPASAPELSALASLDLSGNERLVGGLPLGAWTRGWGSLRVLNLSGCGLGGSLPSDWSPLPSLEVLDLSFNLLQGTLPASLADLEHLTHLSLAGNGGLTGYLPSSWSSLGRLQLLDVRGDCRLCGSTSALPNLTTALATGSHLDGRCRPNECDRESSGMHDVFLGVIAAFTSVLGLTALLLLLRRVHQCAANAGASAMPAAGAAAGRDRTGDIRRASSFPADGRGRPHRRTRTHTHRRTRHTGGPPQPVPFYTVELGPDGYVKWWVEIAGPPPREHDSVSGSGGGGGGGGDRSQPLEALGPLANTTSALREGDPVSGVGDGGSSISRQLEMERSSTSPALQSSSPPPPPPQQHQEQQLVQQQQPYGRRRVAVQEHANDEDEDEDEGQHDGEEAGQGQAHGEVAGRQALGSEPQDPVRQWGRGREQQPEREQGEGRQQQQQLEEQEEERQRGRELWSVVGFLDEVRRTAGRADAEDADEDPAAAVVAATPAAGPGFASVPPAVIASEAAAAPAALPAAEDEDAVQVSNAVRGAVAGSAAAAGSLDAASAEGDRPSPRRDSVSGDAATAQPATVAGGSPYAAAVRVLSDVLRRKLARPPDAVILMPDGEEVCLGRLMVSHNDSDGGGIGDGDGVRRRTYWTGNLAVTWEEAAAVAATAAATSHASGPSVTLLAVGGLMGSPSGEPSSDDDVGAGAGGGSPSAVAADTARPPPSPGGSARGTPSITVTVSFGGSSSGASGRTGGGGGDSGDDTATGPAACPGACDLEAAVVVAAAAARAAAVSEPLGGERPDGTASSSSSLSSSSSSRPSAAPMRSGAAPPAIASEARAASPPGSAVAKDTATTVQRVGASPGWAAPAALSVAAPAAAGERGRGGSGGGGGGGSGGGGGGGHVEAGDSRRFRLYGGGERGSRRGA